MHLSCCKPFLHDLPNIETCGDCGVWAYRCTSLAASLSTTICQISKQGGLIGCLIIQKHVSCCKPVHHDLPNIETRGDWLACTYVQQKSAKNRQNPHHSLEPNWIQMTREGYGWLFHSCCNDRYPLNVRIHHDSFSTLVATVVSIGMVNSCALLCFPQFHTCNIDT